MASLKERDRVQEGREVLVWQREEGKQKEDISEDTIFGKKKSSENVSDEVVLENVNVKDEEAFAIEHTNKLANLIVLLWR